MSPLEHWIGTTRRTWNTHRTAILRVSIALLGCYATLKLSTEFWRLLFDPSPAGAIDLQILNRQTRAWFDGHLVYAGSTLAPHPPATFAILYPFLGWLEFSEARWVWAATTVVMLGTLTILLVRASGATTRLERGLVALMLLSMNATGVTIGNGQVILHILPVLLTGVLMIRAAPSARRHWLGSSLLVLALVKPSVTAPFLWPALFGASRVRLAPMLTIGAGYLGLTLLAASYQPVGLMEVLSTLGTRGADFTGDWSYANVTALLTDLGLIRWSLPTSALVFASLGVWVRFNRRADPWILLGVCALVVRLGIYHLGYDDVLLIVPMLALFRVAKSDSDEGRSLLAGALLAINIGSMLFLASWQFARPPLQWLFVWGHPLVWIVDLIALIRLARYHHDSAESADHPAPAGRIG